MQIYVEGRRSWRGGEGRDILGLIRFGPGDGKRRGGERSGFGYIWRSSLDSVVLLFLFLPLLLLFASSQVKSGGWDQGEGFLGLIR